MTSPNRHEGQALAEENMRSGKLFTATPLPTRTRPGPAIALAAEWATYRELATKIPERAIKKDLPELARLPALDTDTPPVLSAEAFAAWIKDVDTIWSEGTRSSQRTGNALDEPYVAVLASIARIGIATLGAEAMVEVAIAVLPTYGARHDSYRRSAWAEPITLALRHAFPATPDEADYDAAIAAAHTRIVGMKGARQYFAFAFGDDRADAHPLQAAPLLHIAEERGIDVGATLELLPLVAESAPSAAARWRKKRTYMLYFTYMKVRPEVVAATLVATARHVGESALPGLDWLMFYAADDDVTTIARAMLETREDDALAALLPYHRDKKVRAAIDAATQIYPVWTFRQLLSLISGKHNEPALRARLQDLIARHGDEVRGWASGAGASELATLDAQLATANQPTAPADALPPLLRDMPWRVPASKRKRELALDLTPIGTPFEYTAGELDDAHVGRQDWIVIDDLAGLGAFVHVYEGHIHNNPWSKVEAAADLPAPEQLTGEQWVAWLAQRLEAILAQGVAVTGTPYHELYSFLERHHETLALALWNQPQVTVHGDLRWEQTVARMMARYGERAAPGFAGLVGLDPEALLPVALPVDSADVAPHAARALTALKTARPHAEAWLRRHRRTAMLRLIPDAVGKPGPLRNAAEQTLRWFIADADDGRTALDEAVAAYATVEPLVADAIKQVLARDPADDLPAKPPRLPTWFQPASLPRPELVDGAGALGDDAVRGLAEMLMLARMDGPYAGLARVATALTPASRAAFAWDLFEAWLAQNGPAKENWAMRAVGWLGDDECARKLTPLIRKWPGESAHTRAALGLDVLRDIGSDIALMHLNGIAEKLKFKGLQDKAREKITAIAEARGMSAEDLADRLPPDLGLDEQGGLDLDFGPRSFRVGFDEFLKPWVRDADGRRLADLPKPGKADDAALAKTARATWSALKKDARAIATLQIARLEAMLADSRRIEPDVFNLFFVRHPLIRHLAQRLVWGVFPDRDARSRPSQVFRIAESLAAADVQDDAVDLDVASGLIGLVHPLHLDDTARAAWTAVFADYEIAQPFPQLARETYELNDAELGLGTIERFAQVEVDTTRLRGMSDQGWRIGTPQDGGVALWLHRPVSYRDGTRGEAYLQLAEGIFVGAQEYEPATQKMGTLALDDPWGDHQADPRRRFKDLDPISASEVLRIPSLVARHTTS